MITKKYIMNFCSINSFASKLDLVFSLVNLKYISIEVGYMI